MKAEWITFFNKRVLFEWLRERYIKYFKILTGKPALWGGRAPKKSTTVNELNTMFF